MQHPQPSSAPFHSGALAPAPALTSNPVTSYYRRPSATTSSAQVPRPAPISRNHSVSNNGTLNLDPVPGDEGTTFIHPPFNDFPNSENHKGGLTYTLMAANPEWFLDVKDFVGGDNTVSYPTQLEPPRGWCPAKKKDIREGWKEGEEPRLRCTFCRRTYAGVNAKSMWRRHVYEKHKVPMANRRETMGEKTGGRGARSSNKENKQKGTDPEKDDNLPADKSVRRSVSMELHVKRPYYRERSPVSARLLEEEASIPHSPSAQGHPTTPGLDSQALQQEALNYFSLTMPGDNAVFLDSLEKTYGNIDGLFSRSTPPQTPGLSPSKSSGSRLNIPPESPYDPLRTPAFRHSPARLPSDQPWRASGAASSQAVRQLTLGMLVCGEASPTVRGLDVSPIVIVPASERKKRSIFSPPTRTPTAERSLALLASMQDDPDQGGLIPSPRQLFADTASGRTPSILSRMGDFDWASSTFTPLKSAAPLGVNQSPFADIEDPFKAYIQCSPAPKSLGDSSPAQPPSSSGSDSSAPRKGFDAPCTELPASPTPASGSTRSSAFPTMSKLRWRVFPEEDSEVDAMMDVEDAAVLVPNPDMAKLGLGTPVRLAEPIHRRTNSNDTTDDSIDSSSSAAPSSGTSDRVILSSGSSASAHSRRDGSPFRFGSHGRQRSASGSSSSHKSSLSSLGASAGLMDKILGRQDRPQRRRTSHNHDNEVSVDAMGSPFKLGRKTSRSEFLYSLDGDCEMQEAQPKKRRRTISGRD